MSNVVNVPQIAEAPPKRSRSLLPAILGGILLFVCVCLLIYWADWKAARLGGHGQDSLTYLQVYQTFLNDVEAGRLAEAYAATTKTFQKEVDRGEFEDRANRYRKFKENPIAKGVQGQSSGPIGGDYKGLNFMTISITMEDGEGNRLQKTTKVVQEDSFLHRRPPPPRIGDFTVSEIAKKS